MNEWTDKAAGAVQVRSSFWLRSIKTSSKVQKNSVISTEYVDKMSLKSFALKKETE